MEAQSTFKNKKEIKQFLEDLEVGVQVTVYEQRRDYQNMVTRITKTEDGLTVFSSWRGGHDQASEYLDEKDIIDKVWDNRSRVYSGKTL